MRVLLIGLNYLPESTSIGPYTADLAEYLLQEGHDVRVIAGFPMAPQWRVWDGYRGRLWMRETIHRVPVLRTFLYVPQKPDRALKRILFDTSFAASALVGGLFSRRADVILAISPPLQLGITAWILALRHRAPAMLHLQDLVPDAAITVGLLHPDSWTAHFAWALERFLYRKVNRIGVICEGFRRNLANKGMARARIALLPNYIDPDFIRPGARFNRFRRRAGVAEREFLAMYSGSIAMKQGLRTFVEAAAHAPEVRFFLVGEGPYMPELRETAEKLALRNIDFLPLQPRQGLGDQLTSADALVITQKRSVTDVVFPGKLLYYMAAGRPIVAAVAAESETGRFIAAEQVGLVVPPENPQALAEALLFLKGHTEAAENFGSKGRRVVERRFNRAVVLREFAAELHGLVGNGATSCSVPSAPSSAPST